MEFKKGHVPWNKGKNFVHSGSFKKGHKINVGRKRNQEFKRKLSEFNKGKTLSKETKIKLRQIALEQFKNGVSEATKKKMSEAREGKKSPFYGKHHTEEFKEKKRRQRAKQIFPIKDTKIEVKIQNFLKKLGIEFFTHQYIKIEHGYQCDVLIPSMNLVIECDGDYWHKYPIGRDIDHIRTNELIKKGFKVLRLWEVEINEMSINKFKEKLEHFK